MLIQRQNPKTIDVRPGDKLYDIANDMLWDCTDLTRDNWSITIEYKGRKLIIDSSGPMDGWMLIRKIQIDI